MRQDSLPRDVLAADEIDLRRVLAFLRRWWLLIVVCGILGGASALAVSLLQPSSFEATVNLVIVRSAAIFNFDEKIQSVSDVDPRSSADLQDRRKSLAAVAASDEVAARVLAALGDQLDPALRSVAALRGRVRAVTDGDLIQIVAQAGSPEQATLVANAWARAYEALTNEVFRDDALTPDVLQEQLAAAKSAYEARQAELVTFLEQDPSTALAARVLEKKQLLSELQNGKQKAVAAVISQTRDAQTRLLKSYLDALVKTRSAIIDQQVDARVQTLADLYSQKSKLERLRAGAQLLRDRLDASPATSLPGDELAAALLEASAFTSGADLPVNLQVPLDQLAAGTSSSAQRDVLDSLIRVLDARTQELTAQIDTQSKKLLDDSQYQNLAASSNADESPLRTAANQSVQALLRMDGLEGIASDDDATSALAPALNALYGEINQLQAQLEQANAKKQELTRARDLAWTTYTALANKLAETNLAEQAKGSVVRIATPAVASTRAAGARTQLNTVLGVFGGLFVGVVLALVLENLTGGARAAAPRKS